MKIRRLVVNNFRGIKKLEWTPEDDNLICLIGHGDSTKSSILASIEFALFPHWNLKLTDADFYECKPVQNPIYIELIIGDVTNSEILHDPLFSTAGRYWDSENKCLVNSSEAEGKELVLQIIFRADETLEPTWFISNESGVEEVMKQGKRALFNMTRFDDKSERNFKWGYNTMLSKITEKNGQKEIKSVLAEAGRSARENFDENKLDSDFHDSSRIVSEEAKIWGAGHKSIKPFLDVFSAEALCLNDENNIPIHMMGAGSKKLILIAMAKYLFSNDEIPEGHILLMDELENGLEPHRLIHVIFSLNEISKQFGSQIIISSHSPIVLKEIAGDGTYRVININNEIRIVKLDPESNGAIRTNPEGFFLKKIVICEGKTEIGLLRALKKKWVQNHAMAPEHLGAYFILGEGSKAPQYIEIFTRFNYEICVYRDSDVQQSLPSGTADFKYQGTINTEQAICKDAPNDLISNIISFCEENGKTNVPKQDTFDSNYREALADFLHREDVFRRIDRGEILGDMVFPYLEQMRDSDFLSTIGDIEQWIYS